MKSVAKKADVVILDSPPALAVADATILASKADLILLVVRSRQAEDTLTILAVSSAQENGKQPEKKA